MRWVPSHGTGSMAALDGDSRWGRACCFRRVELGSELFDPVEETTAGVPMLFALGLRTLLKFPQVELDIPKGIGRKRVANCTLRNPW